MPTNSFTDITVSASVTVVPEHIHSIDQDIDLYGGNLRQIERLKKTIGFDQRRIAPKEVTALDLCHQASERLLSNLNLSAEALDGIIFVTQTPDHSQPSNASLLHGLLGCQKSCAALDIGLGCSGFVYGLWLAFSLINNGSSDKILVLTGDTLSRMVNPQDKATASLFGDGGSATLVQKQAGAGVSWFQLGSDGTGAEALKVPAGGARIPISQATAKASTDTEGNIRTQEDLFMDGASVFNFSIEVVPEAIKALLKVADLPLESLDYLVLHQANTYMVQNIGKRLGIDPARLPIRSFGAFGNLSSASIPGALAYELADELTDKKTSKPQKLIFSGFGVGLSWGSCLLPLEPLKCLEWLEYKQ
tara:strand:- start:1070 stop:2155 length:1086 start_codon:yes stop_codon:yes gene_type:complete